MCCRFWISEANVEKDEWGKKTIKFAKSRTFAEVEGWKSHQETNLFFLQIVMNEKHFGFLKG